VLLSKIVTKFWHGIMINSLVVEHEVKVLAELQILKHKMEIEADIKKNSMV
jgi:hypothetical protein